MDQKTKEFVEQCEQHLLRGNNEEFGDLARDDLPEALRIIREQDTHIERLTGLIAKMYSESQR